MPPLQVRLLCYHSILVNMLLKNIFFPTHFRPLYCSAVRIYKENAAIAAGVFRKWSSSKGLSKARLADTQRYTRKVKTCEKDLAKAKENLEKWSHSSVSVSNDATPSTLNPSTDPAAPEASTKAPVQQLNKRKYHLIWP